MIENRKSCLTAHHDQMLLKKQKNQKCSDESVSNESVNFLITLHCVQNIKLNSCGFSFDLLKGDINQRNQISIAIARSAKLPKNLPRSGEKPTHFSILILLSSPEVAATATKFVSLQLVDSIALHLFTSLQFCMITDSLVTVISTGRGYQCNMANKTLETLTTPLKGNCSCKSKQGIYAFVDSTYCDNATYPAKYYTSECSHVTSSYQRFSVESSYKVLLGMCNSCNPDSTKTIQQSQQFKNHQQNNCEVQTICSINNCHQIYLSDSINNSTRTDPFITKYGGGRKSYFASASNILSYVKRSKFIRIVKSKFLVHAIIFMLVLQLLTLPTTVFGLSNTNQTLQHHHQTNGAATSLLSSSSSLAAGSDSDGLSSFISRENSIRREPNLSYTSGGCHTCRLREQVKADNLASIKRHILLRLELKTPPNITSPVVPREIIEKFYKNHSMFNRSATSNPESGNRRTINTPSSYDSMQGDDPRTYIDYSQNSEENESEDYEEEFFSVVNSLYVFPTMPRMRHNRKPDILHFSFANNGHSTVSEAVLHVYIRGRDWIREHEPSTLTDNENFSTNRPEIVLTINRVLRRQNSPNSTHTQKVNEIRQIIPNGSGSWITIDITEMVTNWFNSPNTNHGLIIKTLEPWMKPLVITDDNPTNKAYALYIEIQTKDNRKRRTKRNTSLNCSESDNEERCCRYPLEVDFRKFDWNWIVAPTSFNAYFCNGECKLGFLPKYPHTHLMQLSTAPQPCCSPTKMSPIKLLYFNNDRNLVMSTIPNMAVDKCSCS